MLSTTESLMAGTETQYILKLMASTGADPLSWCRTECCAFLALNPPSVSPWTTSPGKEAATFAALQPLLTRAVRQCPTGEAGKKGYYYLLRPLFIN